MKNQQILWKSIVPAIGLLILILDTKTAIEGAKEGITLCLNSIIPTLLPFCVLSKLITASIFGVPIKLLKPISKLCRIPEGAESILILGFLGGYPIGAQCINDTYKSGGLTKVDAQRLLGFCNNAGPAFLFGILSVYFKDSTPLLTLFVIQVLSALIVGILLPSKGASNSVISMKEKISLTKVIEESVRAISSVCCWVIIFKIILTFFQAWFLWLLPNTIQIIFAGCLELSNGCFSLDVIPLAGLRFILSATFLSAGGLCVAMQTISVTKDVGIGLYFPGKLLQMSISLILAIAMQHLIFPIDERCSIPIVLPVICCAFITIIYIFICSKKKVIAFIG